MIGKVWLVCYQRLEQGRQRKVRTNMSKVQIGVVVKCMHRLQVNVASMRLIHNLNPGRLINRAWLVKIVAPQNRQRLLSLQRL